MGDKRIQLECLQCASAVSSTDPKAVNRFAELHEQRNPGHQMVDVDDDE
jgi:hypothetical protein